MKRIKSYPNLQLKLQEIVAVNAQLREDNSHLKALLGMNAKEIEVHFQTSAKRPNQMAISPTVTNSSSTGEKVALFRSLFRGRVDVYPVRWEGKDGKSGYSPACGNEWKKGVCRKAQG